MLGPYEVLAKLGEGRMGEVYRARDTRLERTVAIKVLSESLASDPQFRQRFDREARTISQLDHPHICALHDVGEQGGIAYLVMQYLEGETIAARLARLSTKGLSLDEALTIAIQIAGALDKAHRAGIIHRDLKPANVMLTSSGAKLLDFGLAKSPSAPIAAVGRSALPTTPAGLTAQGAILGTLQYMAPEQLEGGAVDARTDIFAFGSVVHEMCTGRKAFDARSSAGLIAAILEHEAPSISSLQPLSPPALDRVVKTCLAKNPDDRWQSARDLVRQLTWIAEGRAGDDRTVSAIHAGGRANAGRVWRASIASMLAGIALAAMTMWLMRPVASPQAQPVVRLTMTLPDDAPIVNGAFPALEFSPLGTHLVYVGERAGQSRLYLRQMDTFATRAIPGSEGAMSPFFSPDGQWVAFVAGES
jgi:serine/threonine-protein kinase